MIQEKRNLIIDSHIHLFQSLKMADKIKEVFNHKYSIPNSLCGEGVAEDSFRMMESSGIDYSVISNFSTARHVDSINRFSLSITENYSRFKSLISIHPDMPELSSTLLDEYFTKGALGIKLHPMAQEFMPADPKLEMLYDWCSERKAPVVFHCGRVANARLNEFSDYENIRPVADAYPDIPLVLTHMADGNIETIRKSALEYPALYYETSIVMTGNPAFRAFNDASWKDDAVFIDVVHEIGAHRILFGSDYPWGNPMQDLKRIQEMNITQDEKDLILGGNAASLFGIN